MMSFYLTKTDAGSMKCRWDWLEMRKKINESRKKKCGEGCVHPSEPVDHSCCQRSPGVQLTFVWSGVCVCELFTEKQIVHLTSLTFLLRSTRCECVPVILWATLKPVQRSCKRHFIGTITNAERVGSLSLLCIVLYCSNMLQSVHIFFSLSITSCVWANIFF